MWENGDWKHDALKYSEPASGKQQIKIFNITFDIFDIL